MATKSFSTNFRITKRNADAIADAISKSRKVAFDNEHKVKTIKSVSQVNEFFKKALKIKE